MAYIDAENLFFEDEVVAAAMTSNVIDLGNPGPFMHPLYIDIRLTTKMTSGSMTTFALQSSADAAFTSPVTEVTITLPAAAVQQAGPCVLAQFFAPIKPSHRYIRLSGVGATPVGGKVTATMQNGIKVGIGM